eukprot:357321-Chlamydomonas_euryale.AAC.2
METNNTMTACQASFPHSICRLVSKGVAGPVQPISRSLLCRSRSTRLAQCGICSYPSPTALPPAFCPHFSFSLAPPSCCWDTTGRRSRLLPPPITCQHRPFSIHASQGPQRHAARLGDDCAPHLLPPCSSHPYAAAHTPTIIRDPGVVLHNWETLASSEPTQHDGPTGWRPLRRGVSVDGCVNDGRTKSRGWGVEMAIPWSILGQVGAVCRDDQQASQQTNTPTDQPAHQPTD